MSDGPALEVLATGPLAVLQDRGRPGFAHLGVSASGAADRAAHDAANRLVGNTADAATLELLVGGARMRALRPVLVAAVGADAALVLRRRAGSSIVHPSGSAVVVLAGEEIEMIAPTWGLRTYLAVRGGIDGPRILGSRSTDTLGGLGPEPVRAGDLIALAGDEAGWPAAEVLPERLDPAAPDDVVTLALFRGPRDAALSAEGWRRLTAGRWTIGSDSDRIGVRLEGDPLPVDGAAQLPSEGVVAGAVQLPPSGLPVVFLRDHPVTGGYPVVGVLTERSIDAAAQLRPGDPVRLLVLPH